MFKFNFGQVLDYPLDRDDVEDEMEIEDEIVIDIPQEPSFELPKPSKLSTRLSQDHQCEDVPLDEIVRSLYLSRNILIILYSWNWRLE